ncbi:MAG: hypothetical protein QGD94_01420 [Planctomycetia bacterium]|nr:hypothetical protein [Planctomycetia bacterium]
MTLAFFRKHHKLFMVLMILAVVMMVFWLVISKVPEVLRQWFGEERASKQIAEVYGKGVTRGEMWDFRQRLQVSANAAVTIHQMLGQRRGPGEQRAIDAVTIAALSPYAQRLLGVGSSSGGMSDKDFWAAFTIHTEAREMGFDIPDARLKGRLKELRELGMTADDYRRLLSMVSGRRQDILFEAWRQDMNIKAYLQFASSMPTVVGAHLEQEFRNIDEKVEVRLVALAAEEFLEEVKAPSDQALQEQFEKFKNFLPGEKRPDGFGYKIPDKVAVEYLVISPEAFADEAKITDEQIKQYYDRNKAFEFVIEPEKTEPKPDAEQEKKEPAKDDAPENAGGPEAQAEDNADNKDADKTPKYKPLKEVEGEIRKTLVSRRSGELAMDKIGQISTELTALRVRKVAIKFETFADGKVVWLVKPVGLMGREELGELEGIGKAVSTGNMPFAGYALSLEELEESEEGQALLRVGRESSTLADQEGNQYIFRVRRLVKSHVPADISIVREAVEKDVARIEAFELAKAKGREVLAEANKTGLVAAAEKLKQKLYTPEPFPQKKLSPMDLLALYYGIPVSPKLPNVPPIGQNRALVERCFRLAEGPKKVELLILQSARTAVVIELIRVHLPKRSAFELQKLQMNTLAWARGEFFRAFLNTENILRRGKVVLPEKVVDEDTEDAADEKTPGQS